MKTESGFTIIEIIVSLLLVGFMAAFAGTGIVTFTGGYLFTKENAHMAQKANLALTRLTREFQELEDVSNASNTAVTIDSKRGVRTIGLDDGKIKIAETGIALADGDILIDDVSINFSLDEQAAAVEITAKVKGSGKTGFEMEALTAVAISGLTIYDMCKAVDSTMRLENVRLTMKSGGKSGTVVLE